MDANSARTEVYSFKQKKQLSQKYRAYADAVDLRGLVISIA